MNNTITCPDCSEFEKMGIRDLFEHIARKKDESMKVSNARIVQEQLYAARKERSRIIATIQRLADEDAHDQAVGTAERVGMGRAYARVIRELCEGGSDNDQ
jgi:division protein CdvB (Snf7/Vps24/ESCRT-III family)